MKKTCKSYMYRCKRIIMKRINFLILKSKKISRIFLYYHIRLNIQAIKILIKIKYEPFSFFQSIFHHFKNFYNTIFQQIIDPAELLNKLGYPIFQFVQLFFFNHMFC